MVPKEYLEYIKNKLDAMNKMSGFNPDLQKQKQVVDPGYIDPLDMMGRAAIKYMQNKKNSENS